MIHFIDLHLTLIVLYSHDNSDLRVRISFVKCSRSLQLQRLVQMRWPRL